MNFKQYFPKIEKFMVTKHEFYIKFLEEHKEYLQEKSCQNINDMIKELLDICQLCYSYHYSKIKESELFVNYESEFVLSTLNLCLLDVSVDILLNEDIENAYETLFDLSMCIIKKLLNNEQILLEQYLLEHRNKINKYEKENKISYLFRKIKKL